MSAGYRADTWRETHGRSPRCAGRPGRRSCRRGRRPSTAVPGVTHAGGLARRAIEPPDHIPPEGDEIERLADRLGLALRPEDLLGASQRSLIEKDVLPHEPGHWRLRSVLMYILKISTHAITMRRMPRGDDGSSARRRGQPSPPRRRTG